MVSATCSIRWSCRCLYGRIINCLIDGMGQDGIELRDGRSGWVLANARNKMGAFARIYNKLRPVRPWRSHALDCEKSFLHWCSKSDKILRTLRLYTAPPRSLALSSFNETRGFWFIMLSGCSHKYSRRDRYNCGQAPHVLTSVKKFISPKLLAICPRHTRVPSRNYFSSEESCSGVHVIHQLPHWCWIVAIARELASLLLHSNGMEQRICGMRILREGKSWNDAG